MQLPLTQISHWAFIGGIILAIGAGLIAIPYITAILFILGLVVGFLNITEKESLPFLIAVIALLIIGVAGLQLGELTTMAVSILTKFITFVSAAGLVVAIKQVVVLAQLSKDESKTV